MESLRKAFPRLDVHEKSGFRNTTGTSLVILDERGDIFYDTRELEQTVWEFNLPQGTYYIQQGKFTMKARPVDFPTLPLPPIERNKRCNPEDFKIVFAPNPYKCTIYWTKRTIVYDPALKECELVILVYIFYHECAHKYYETELACDTYAYNRMIDAGYNPSQILYAQSLTLSDAQDHRKEGLAVAALDSFNDFDHFDFEGGIVLQNRIDENITLGTKVDEKWDTADDYLGATLVAKKALVIYTRPNGTRYRAVFAGDTIGTIYSWKEENGQLWWMIDKDAKGNYSFVEAKAGNFETEIARQSVRDGIAKRNKEIQAKTDERLANNENPLYRGWKGFEDFLANFDLSQILIYLIILVALIVAYKIFA